MGRDICRDPCMLFLELQQNVLPSLVFVKWLTERSHFSYNEGGIPIAVKDNNFPDLYKAFEGIEFIPDNPAGIRKPSG